MMRRTPLCVLRTLPGFVLLSLGGFMSLGHCAEQARSSLARAMPEFADLQFRFQPAEGIGREENITRRDVSDVIRAGNTYYIWYSKVDQSELPPELLRLKHSGYVATVWYAVSTDEGHTWEEKGEALGLGERGQFDSFAVFTPNIVKFEGRYYLYYDAVRPSDEENFLFENNSTTEPTAIGVAVADSPDGPFRRIANNPVLVPTSRSTDQDVPSAFDSYRVDDAALLVRDYDGDGDLDIGLYYKGRNFDHGRRGPGLTCMGLAIADSPESEHVRANDGKPILTGSHEVMIWPHREGVAAYASQTETFEYAPDGIDFLTNRLGAKATPKPIAPGCFRADLTEPVTWGKGIHWGICLKEPGGPCPYLVRFEVDLSAPPPPESRTWLGESFSLTVPSEIQVTARSPVEDFVLYTLKQGNLTLLSAYEGNHPTFPSDAFETTGESSGTIGGFPARFRSRTDRDGMHFREVLIDVSRSKDWPQCLHFWYTALTSEVAKEADQIIASMRLREGRE